MAKGRAKIAIGQGVSVWVLEAPGGFGDAAFHSHHAIQITAALSGSLSLTSADRTLAAPIVAVAADARHRFEAQGLLAFFFIEPESRAGRALSARLFHDRELAAIGDRGLEHILQRIGSAFEATLGSEQLVALGLEAVAAIATATDTPPPDPRIQRILEYTAAHLDQPLSLTAASEGVYLSPSRLRHLFVEQTGLAYKTYVLWLRLIRAVEDYAQGQSLTQAAHSAGFSDSAHFSRVFRRTFGLPATTLTRV